MDISDSNRILNSLDIMWGNMSWVNKETLLREYKEFVKKHQGAPTKADLEMEQYYLDQIRDQPDKTANDWRYYYRRWKIVHNRLYHPTAREKVIGVRSGHSLTARERAKIKFQEIVDQINDDIIQSIRGDN